MALYFGKMSGFSNGALGNRCQRRNAARQFEVNDGHRIDFELNVWYLTMLAPAATGRR